MAAPRQTYEYYRDVFDGIEAPFAFVDLDAMWSNSDSMLERAGEMAVRPASKSIRCRSVIDRILARLRETEKEAPARPLLVPPTRAPPATLSLFAGTEFRQQGRH